MNVFQSVINGSRLCPEKQALVFEKQKLTYAQVERLTAHAAHVLRELGVSRGDRVGMVIPNVPAFVIWYYATLRLGAVAVSVSTRLAPQEVAFILTDCDASLLLATDEHMEALTAHLPSCVEHCLPVSDDANHFEGKRLVETNALAEDDWVDAEPDEPAVILYTSGTTGFPKGATLSHQNIRATVHAFNHLCQMQQADRILLAVPLFHCYGQNALLNAGFNVGVTLILQRRADLAESKSLIQEHQVTKLFGVPTTFQLMLQSCTPAELNSIDYCFSAAATLPLQLSTSWRERFGMPIYEGYGLTETAPFASYNHRVQYVPGSIGTPVDLVEMKIIDPESGEACPPGERGEIVIRGPNVMLGYWNRPEETAAAIRNGWFRSGDVGYVDRRGFFFIVDRLKDMISVGGMKVFPAEVERVLLDYPSVLEVAVVGLPDQVMGEKVAAFIVVGDVTAFSLADLKKHCHEQLGSFKTPRRIEFVQELPRNPAGKVLKTQLREQWGQDQSSHRIAAVLAASSSTGKNADEEAYPPLLLDRLKKVHQASRHRWLTAWLQEEVRAVAELDEAPQPDAQLMEVGLDSLLIVELRDRLQQEVGTGIELPATLVFDHPRIRDLATHLLESLDCHTESHAADGQIGSHATSGPTGVKVEPGSGPIGKHIEELSEEDALRELMRELDE